MTDNYERRNNREIFDRLNNLGERMASMETSMAFGIEQRVEILDTLKCIKAGMVHKVDFDAHIGRGESALTKVKDDASSLENRVDVLERDKSEAKGVLRVIAWLVAPIAGAVGAGLTMLGKKLGL